MRRVQTPPKSRRHMFLALSAATISILGFTPHASAARHEVSPYSNAVDVSPAMAVAASTSYPVVETTGHGWGHGRGMSQYGALGYAELGWTSAQILDHYYGGTVGGTVPAGVTSPDSAALRVDLRTNREHATRVDIELGSIRVLDGATLIVETAADSGQAVRIDSSTTGLLVETAASCSGPWTEIANVATTTLEIQKTTSDDTADGLLRVCEPTGSSTWYDGALRTYSFGAGPGVAGTPRTVNIVTVEQYLRGVVPKEMPASWPAAALQAQAVSARSYALAGDSRWKENGVLYADTCDTTTCQVYKGRYTQSSSFITSSHPNTDAAISATAGLVRVAGSAVARTEFSSSTGGYTAGGTFPSVPDEGDAVASNPNYDWSLTSHLQSIESDFGLGQLVNIEVTARNGLGRDGGRATTVLFTFTEGAVTKTGSQARTLLGLKSDWFSVVEIRRVTTDTAIANYIDHIYELFLGRTPDGAEESGWILDVELGRRHNLTGSLALTEEWAGVMVDGFYETALGRPSDDDGRAHWLGQIANGVRVETIGAHFYGSNEYFIISGNTNEALVTALYRDLLGRAVDSEGLAFWTGELDAGRMTSGDVAAGFYASIESRESRVRSLYQQILLRSPDSSGLEYWAGELLTTDDVRLASQLAASDESFLIAQR